jgi:hypothetical protein
MPCVAAVRIAAFVLAVLVPLAGAQQSSQRQLLVRVLDTTGGVIPKAHISIEPPFTSIDSDLKTDSRGQATLALPAGSYTLLVSMPGFKQWIQQIGVQSGMDQTVTVSLEVDPRWSSSRPGPGCPLDTRIGLQTIARNDLIPPAALSNLAPLPTRLSKKHWW